MAKSSIEDLIKSAKNTNNPYYLRKNYAIEARSHIRSAQIDLELLDIELRKINTSQIKDSHNQLKMVSSNCGLEATEMSTGCETPTTSVVEHSQQIKKDEEFLSENHLEPRSTEGEDNTGENMPEVVDNQSADNIRKSKKERSGVKNG